MNYSKEQQEKGEKIMSTLIEEALSNPEFKQQLIKDPVSAIEELTGDTFSMPAGKKVVVEDQSNDSVIYLNIPAEPNLDGLELTGEQLELVSGGITPTFIALGYGFMAGVAFIGAAAGVAAVIKD